MLSEEEKVRVRHHMGMPLLRMAPTMVGGVPLPTEMLTRLELAMDLIHPAAEPHVRGLITACDRKEQQIMDVDVRLQVAKAEGIEMRSDEADQRRREYMYWVGLLQDALGVPRNPFSEREQFKPSRAMTNVGLIGVIRS